jgi:serine/threonine protein kinase
MPQEKSKEDKWAFKVWVNEIPDNRIRYKIISEHLKKCKLPYFSEFEYIENGLLVPDKFLKKSQLVDTCRIKWIEGTTLTEYISLNLRNKLVLNKLAKDFLKMIKEFHRHKISHGDLQHDNIIINANGDIKLIDYDSLCVPQLNGQRDFFRGRQGYQHPLRFMYGFITSIKIDYFSELIIYLSILAVIENPILWDKYSVSQSEYRLLFSINDFQEWEDSGIRKDLYLLSPQIQNLVRILDNYLAAHINLVPFSSKTNSFLDIICNRFKKVFSYSTLLYL